MPEFWALPLVVHFAWKERCPEVQVYTNLWAMANTWLEGQKNWKKCDWKIGVREIWRKHRLTDLSKQAGLWRYLCSMWMLSKGWTQQRNILKIRWRRWAILWTSVSLFLQQLLSLPKWLMSKVTMVAEMKVLQGHSNVDVYLPGTTWLWLLQRAQSANSRGQQWAPLMAPFPATN